jgi:hypothetical protein
MTWLRRSEFYGVAALTLTACAGGVPSSPDAGTDARAGHRAEAGPPAAEADVGPGVDAAGSLRSGRSCMSFGIVELQTSVAGVHVNIDAAAPLADGGTPCQLTAPCLVEEYRTLTGSGRLFCSPDARWWGYQDSRSYAKVSSTSEAFYLNEVLCYESGDSVYGPSGSPPTHITESKGSRPYIPDCEPGCCPL